MAISQYLSVPEVAALLVVSDTHVIRLIKTGRLRGVNVGTGAKNPRFRVSQVDLQAFLDGNTPTPLAPPAARVRKRAADIMSGIPQYVK